MKRDSVEEQWYQTKVKLEIQGDLAVRKERSQDVQPFTKEENCGG